MAILLDFSPFGVKTPKNDPSGGVGPKIGPPGGSGPPLIGQIGPIGPN